MSDKVWCGYPYDVCVEFSNPDEYRVGALCCMDGKEYAVVSIDWAKSPYKAFLAERIEKP
jgi:hypothetical protein